MKAALVSPLPEDQLTQLKSDYPQIEWIEAWHDREMLQGLGPDIEIVYGNVRPFEFEKLPGIKWVHATWTGVENLLSVTAARPEVIVTNTRGHVSRAITEHIVGSLFYLSRHFGKFHEYTMNGEWCRVPEVKYVEDSHALVIGLGGLGEPVCNALKANKVRVSGVNSKGTPVDFCENVYSPESCKEILGTVDHVICCLPSTKATDHFIDKAFLDTCKDGVTLINVGRGNAVNQDDLLAAVESGRVKGAVLDTTTPEPLPKDSPLYRNERILITSHQSWRPSDFGTVAFDTFIRNLGPFLAGEEMPGKVDPKKGY